MEELLKLTSGVCWSTVYITLIYQGFKHKSYGMPFIALALNFGWEFIYSFYHFDLHNISLQRGVNIFWLLLDAVIVYQYFSFGKQYFPKKLSTKLFIPWSIVVLIACFLIEYLFLVEFERSAGAKYSAFLQNLVMSFLFIDQLIKRTNLAELSMVIAVVKWIGTLAPTILFGMDNPFILTIGILCSVIDVVYIVLLYYYKRENGKTTFEVW